MSAVMATMLLFQFEALDRATRRDLAIAWLPLVLLDLAIIEFLVGVVCWYYGKTATWRGALMATQFAVLLGGCLIVSTWMWFNMKEKGGLGREEASKEDVLMPAIKKHHVPRE